MFTYPIIGLKDNCLLWRRGETFNKSVDFITGCLAARCRNEIRDNSVSVFKQMIGVRLHSCWVHYHLLNFDYICLTTFYL